MNPERLREAYGKIMYVLQDSSKKEVEELFNFKCSEPVRTVFDVLSKHPKGIELLQDQRLTTATTEIRSENKERRIVDMELR